MCVLNIKKSISIFLLNQLMVANIQCSLKFGKFGLQAGTKTSSPRSRAHKMVLRHFSHICDEKDILYDGKLVVHMKSWSFLKRG